MQRSVAGPTGPQTQVNGPDTIDYIDGFINMYITIHYEITKMVVKIAPQQFDRSN